MKCSNCGTELPYGSMFCSECGAKQVFEAKIQNSHGIIQFIA